jgi:hypothetical protein
MSGAVTTAKSNIALGAVVLANLTTDDENIAIGYQASGDLVSGDRNVMIGYGADASTASISNEITLGGSGVVALRCQQTSITSLADIRDKTDVDHNVR